MIKNKTLQLKLSHLIIGGIILLLLIFLIKCKPSQFTSGEYHKEKTEIDSLQNEISKLKTINHNLDNKIYHQNKVMDSLNREIQITQKVINKTRIYYGKKIKDINSASNSELKKFFSNRYK
jgi:hypothetical protein